MDTKERNVLFIRHLPSSLNKNEKERFLKYFGAENVRVMPTNGRLKNTAFAEFRNEVAAKEAITRLHQVEILNSVLSAEYAKSSHQTLAAKENENFNEKQEKSEDSKYSDDSSKLKAANIKCPFLPYIAPNFGLDYPADPGIRYKYPSPNPDILINICASLLTVPRLYTQVLHLMNKMNLLPPFGPATSIPPMIVDHIQQFYNLELTHEDRQNGVPSSRLLQTADKIEVTEMSESESEYESGDSTDRTKMLDVGVPDRVLKSRKRRRTDLTNKPSKRRRILQNDDKKVMDKREHETKDIGEIFDQNLSDLVKKPIHVKVPVTISPPANEEDSVPPTEHFPTMDAGKDNKNGFGKFAPSLTDENPEDTRPSQKESLLKDYITEKQLAAGRLSSQEMSKSSVFKNYHKGEPTCRLYIKNLSKKVTEKDLEYIFGRFVNFNDENEKNMFDVRLMTQGRMKGQAFIGMPSTDAAMSALKATNGYKLIDKPMVVQFARSAKPR